MLLYHRHGPATVVAGGSRHLLLSLTFFLLDLILKISKQIFACLAFLTISSHAVVSTIILVVQIIINSVKGLVLIRLNKLLTNEVTVNVVVIFLLSSLVEITVEIKEVSPGLGYIVEVPVSLLSHVYEVLTSHGVVEHGGSLDFFIYLSSKEGSLLLKVVNLSGGVGQHKLKGLLSVLQRVHSFINLVRRASPLLHILSLEKSLLVFTELSFLGFVSFVSFTH